VNILNPQCIQYLSQLRDIIN